MSNTYGTALRLTVFGQSHAPAVGMSLDGFPVGFAPDFAALQAFLLRRAPGRDIFSTERREADLPKFLSGFSGGKTCGAPIAAILRNTDIQPEDYARIADTPRPSHADFTQREKFGADADLRGGGIASGRLTAPLCIAGGLCLQYLKTVGITVASHIRSIAGAEDVYYDPTDPQTVCENGYTLEPGAWNAMQSEILAAKQDGDSVGGVIEACVTGLPAGLGEPIFGGMESRLSQILFAVPAVKGVEFGSGFFCARLRGSEHNDLFFADEAGKLRTKTNHSGGILGGITNAMPLIFRTAFKPTPSVSVPQETVRYDGSETTLTVRGRHDPCIVPRALPCVEAAAAIAVLDALLEAKQWI